MWTYGLCHSYNWYAKFIENEEGPVSFVVPHHFSILKGLSEGRGLPHITSTTGKSAPEVQPNEDTPKLRTKSLSPSEVVERSTIGVCKCGLGELVSFLDRYKICRHCEPRPEITDVEVGVVKRRLGEEVVSIPGTGVKQTPSSLSSPKPAWFAYEINQKSEA